VNNSSNDVRKVICTLLGKLEKYKLGHSLVSIEFISQTPLFQAMVFG
jgi:hypothetical protein